MQTSQPGGIEVNILAESDGKNPQMAGSASGLWRMVRNFGHIGPSHSRQKGMALVVSLVLLTAITLLAIVSLSRSTLQVRMVNDSQISETVFQAALGELEAQYGRMTVQVPQEYATAYRTGADSANPVALPQLSGSADPRMAVSIGVSYNGTASRLNNTFVGDSSVNKFRLLNFIVSAQANSGGNYSSAQSLGIDYLAFGGN